MRVTWRRALKQILDAAGCSQATLADNVPGLNKMALSRHLREPNKQGAYPPDDHRVRAMNRVAARLAGLPQIEAYLTVLALLDGLLAPRGDDLTVDALRLFVEEFDPYFEGGAMRAVVAAGEKLDVSWHRGILGELTLEGGRELVRRLQGKPPRKSSLATFLKTFSEAGASLEGSLRGNEALRQRLTRDRFEARVSEAVAKLNGVAQARMDAVRAIMQSFDEALDYALSEDWAELFDVNARGELYAEYFRRHPHQRTRRRAAGHADASTTTVRKEKNR